MKGRFGVTVPNVQTWSTAGAVIIEIVATLQPFKVKAERPVWLRYSDKLADH